MIISIFQKKIGGGGRKEPISVRVSNDRKVHRPTFNSSICYIEVHFWPFRNQDVMKSVIFGVTSGLKQMLLRVRKIGKENAFS